MPSSATITAFYEFSPNTKARSSQVNQNFSTWRGHNIPVDPNTATAATTITYDLGVDDHRWRTAYLRDIDFQTSTSTATLILKGDTTNTVGSFLFQIEGNTKFQVTGDGVDLTYVKSGTLNTSTAFGTNAIMTMKAVTITSNSTWTSPSYCTNVLVMMCGGGGGGGGGGGKTSSEYGGNGGGSSNIICEAITVSPSTEYSITVGTGGTGGNGGALNNPGNQGSTGGSSTFGTILTALGGNPGAYGSSVTAQYNVFDAGILFLYGGQGGIGGTGITGTSHKTRSFTGGSPGANTGGGGGGAASQFANGANGGAGNGGAAGSNGSKGSGGGGGGRGTTGGSDNGGNGGTGGDGQVIIYYYGF